MLLRKDTLEGIADGRITLQFRRWTRPTVKTGGTLRTPIGMLRMTEVRRTTANQITAEDAQRAGFPTKKALLAMLARKTEGNLYRVSFETGAEDPRIALRSDVALTHDDVAKIRMRLARMDAAAEPWTTKTLELIERNPATRAADLAPQLHQERLPFKANVRKLKTLGLTISLERGYRLSPRGKAYLSATRAPGR